MKICYLKKKQKVVKKTGHTRPYLKKQHKTVQTLKKGLLVITGGLIVLVGKPYLINTQHLFALNSIKVFGCRATTRQEIIDWAGIRKGSNILSVDLMAASERLENHPWIKEAIVRRRLPGELDIFLTERKPLAVIKLDDLYFVDQNAAIFKKVDDGKSVYPLLSGLSVEDICADRQRTQKLICDALYIVRLVKNDAFFNNYVFEIILDKIFGLTLILHPEEISIYFGEEDFSRKLYSLKKILSDLKKRGQIPRTINLRFFKNSYVTIKG